MNCEWHWCHNETMRFKMGISACQSLIMHAEVQSAQLGWLRMQRIAVLLIFMLSSL